MISNHHKFALTAKKKNVVAFLLSQKADIHAEDKNCMQVQQPLDRPGLKLTVLF